MVTTLSAKATLNSGWMWPIVSETGNFPTPGQRVVVLGCLGCIADLS